MTNLLHVVGPERKSSATQLPSTGEEGVRSVLWMFEIRYSRREELPCDFMSKSTPDIENPKTGSCTIDNSDPL